MTIPTPVQIDDATLAFPANALEFMPAMEDIPEEFHTTDNEWTRFAQVWFGQGLSNRFAYSPNTVDPDADYDNDDAETFDAVMIYRQLSAILGSYAPKHEHKIAAVGYLASCWMHDMVYAPKGKDDDHLTALGTASVEEWHEHFRQLDAGEVELQRMDGQ